MLKRVIRGSVRRLKKWLAEDGQLSGRRLPLEDDFAYPRLNAIFSKIMDAGLTRPQYVWGMLQGVNLAQALGVQRVSVLEFGVAGGNGLVAMEATAQHLRPYFDVEVDVYGFDTAAGLPALVDYRDVPNLASPGLYRMDEQKLRSRLGKARLILGNLEDTMTTFVASKPAPVAFVACDVVLYSSTVHALRLFDAGELMLLPMVHCFFDDVLGWTFGDHNGERLAIHEPEWLLLLQSSQPVQRAVLRGPRNAALRWLSSSRLRQPRPRADPLQWPAPRLDSFSRPARRPVPTRDHRVHRVDRSADW